MVDLSSHYVEHAEIFFKIFIGYWTLPNFSHYGGFEKFWEKFNKILDFTKLWSLWWI